MAGQTMCDDVKRETSNEFLLVSRHLLLVAYCFSNPSASRTM